MKVFVVFSSSQGQGETIQKIFKEESDANAFAMEFGRENQWVDAVDVLDYEVE